MELSIIHRVAQLISSGKAEAVIGNKKEAVPKSPVRDTFFISDTASDIKKVSSTIAQAPEREPERQAKLDKIRASIELKQYRMSEEMVNSIAEKIASTLM